MKLRSGAAAFALLVLMSLSLAAATRIGEANQVCSIALAQHRLIGPFLRCVVADTYLQEDDDR